jgi:hypothetical protein
MKALVIAGFIHDAGTIDQHVDRGFLLLHLFDQGLDRVMVLHVKGVAADEIAIGTQRLRRLFEARGSAAGDEETVAQLSQLACSFVTQTPGTTGDQGERQTGHAKQYPRRVWTAQPLVSRRWAETQNWFYAENPEKLQRPSNKFTRARPF